MICSCPMAHMRRKGNMERKLLEEKAQKLVEIGNSKSRTLDFNDINDMYKDDALTPEELEAVYTILEDNKIDVLRNVEDDPGDDSFAKDDAWLEGRGLNIIRETFPGGHDWTVWRRCIRSFLPLLFREE